MVVVWSTFVLALVLSALHLPAAAPDAMGWLQPNWVALVLLYWVMAVPARVGMGSAWLLGLLYDSLTGHVLGLHALLLVLVAYLGLVMYERLRMYSLLQQAMTVLVTLSLAGLLELWAGRVTSGAPLTPLALIPAVTSAVVWPGVFLALRRVRRAAGIA
jgi:rod shape-determining protein MreD